MAELGWRSGFCNGDILRRNKACLHVISQSYQYFVLFSQSEECYMCKSIKTGGIPPKGKVSLVTKTEFPIRMFFLNNAQEWCHTTYSFEEHGQYAWNISDSGCDSIKVLEKPLNTYYPLLGAFLIILLCILLWNLARCAVNYKRMAHLGERAVSSLELESGLCSPSLADGHKLMKSEILPAVRRQKSRIVSLDTFRGISIALMIFVNYGGGGYQFFSHCVWNGLTAADLVFPWFMWIMGVSLVISLQSQLRSSLRRKHLFLKILQRSTILMILGLFLNAFRVREKFVLSYMVLPGVLQRIGITYLIVGTIETMLIKPRGSVQIGRLQVVQDVLDSWLQWLVVIILTMAHLALTFLLPVPGCPTGYLGPGGLHYSLTEGYKYAKCTGGAAGYIDRLVFGHKHMDNLQELREIYHTSQLYDRYGLLGTLTSVLLVYLGVQAGRVILYYQCTFSRIVRWTIWAAITGIAAGILCNFSKNEGWIPVNKSLWSLSFVLAVASMAFFMQSILHLLIDVWHWWSGTPFHYAGMNPLLLYIGHIITNGVFPWCWRSYYHNHAEILAMNLWATALWLFTAYILFRKNVFLSV